MIEVTAPVPVNTVQIHVSDTLTKKEEAHVGSLLGYGLRVVVIVRGSEDALHLEQALTSQNLWVVDRSDPTARARFLLWMDELKQKERPGPFLAHHWGRHEIFAFSHPEPVAFEGRWLELSCSEDGPPLLYKRQLGSAHETLTADPDQRRFFSCMAD